MPENARVSVLACERTGIERVRLRSRAWPVLLILVVATGFALSLLLSTESYDDAYIAYRYAEHWAGGIGLRWNPEDPPVYGASSLLHCLLLSAGKLVGLEPRTTSIGIQTLSHACMSVLVLLFVAPPVGRWAGLCAGILTALSLPNVAQGRGLEIELYTALTVLAMLLVVKGRPFAAGVVSGLAVMTRLDGMVLLAAVLASWMCDEKRWSRAARSIGGAAIPVGIWLIGTMVYFGSPLPQSMLAKLASSYPPPFRIYGLFDHWAGQPIIATCLPFVLVGVGSSVFRKERIVVLWLVLYLCAYRFSGMPCYGWYYTPPMIGVYALAFLGAGHLLRLTRDAQQQRHVRFGIILSALALLGMAAKGAAGPVRATWANRDPRPSAHLAAGQWLKENAERTDRILAFEVGKIGYVSGLQVIDMFGLVSPEILPHLVAGGWTEVIRRTPFDYAFLHIEHNGLPSDQEFREVWVSEDGQYHIVVRSDGM
ncbi:MAG: hypothetical protein JSV19_01285 [Phycisphaerales bacterium]|nr:MAG: hypothetical protein JSV19_01285 [Phycisphaerales bacterium]